MDDPGTAPDVQRLVSTLQAILRGTGCSVAVCESLTGGKIAAALAAGDSAGEWFRGGIIAYHPRVKFDLLNAPEGPVVTAETADAMACAAARLLGADLAVAVTGVGGPASSEGKPPGTVYLATSVRGEAPHAELYRFSGDPESVLHQTVVTALDALIFRARQELDG